MAESATTAGSTIRELRVTGESGVISTRAGRRSTRPGESHLSAQTPTTNTITTARTPTTIFLRGIDMPE
jgi:hypothetical protein